MCLLLLFFLKTIADTFHGKKINLVPTKIVDGIKWAFWFQLGTQSNLYDFRSHLNATPSPSNSVNRSVPLVTMEGEPLGMEAKQLAQEDKQLICDKVEELKYWERFEASLFFNWGRLDLFVCPLETQIYLRRDAPSC